MQLFCDALWAVLRCNEALLHDSSKGCNPRLSFEGGLKVEIDAV